MRVIIAGSRSLNDIEYVNTATRLSYFNITEVVSGMANGIDTRGEEWAKNNLIPVTRQPADWKNLGKSAGFIRNMSMGDYAQALIAIHDGISKGTLHMIKCMKQKKKPVFIYNPLKTNLWDFL